MNKSINIVFLKPNKKADFGYLYIRTIENRIVRKKSLKIKLSLLDYDKYFNSQKQQFRKNKNFKYAEYFNEIIIKNLKEISVYNNLQFIPNEKKSFISYWRNNIKNTVNHGTRIKNEVVLNKLLKFLKSRNNQDLLFIEITPFFLDDLQNYLRTNSDPKILSVNTAIHYLKIIKSIVNKAQKDDYYVFLKNPFHSLKIKQKQVKKPILNELELNKLLNTEILDKKIDINRNIFLFQIFSNGMRISDTLLTRFSNIKNGRLEYKMFKTGSFISIPLNLNMALIIGELSIKMPNYVDFLLKQEIEFRDEEGKIHSIKIKILRRLIESLKTPKITYNPSVNLYVREINEKLEDNIGRLFNYKGHKILKSNTKLIELIDLEHKLQSQIDSLYINAVIKKIDEIKKNNGDEFLFPVMDSTKFKNLKNNNLTEKQYKYVKHKTIVYNRNLNKIRKLCSIETPISSHVARSTFTNLILKMDGVNIYDISLALGHSDIKITENYLRSGFTLEKLDGLSTNLSDRFRKS